MPVTTVSGKIASLERKLGITLIHRTTRRLSITQAGEILFKRGLKAMEELQSAHDELTQSETAPSGRLRITTTSDFGQIYFLPIISTYMKKFGPIKNLLHLNSHNIYRYTDKESFIKLINGREVRNVEVFVCVSGTEICFSKSEEFY